MQHKSGLNSTACLQEPVALLRNFKLFIGGNNQNLYRGISSCLFPWLLLKPSYFSLHPDEFPGIASHCRFVAWYSHHFLLHLP